MNAIYNFVGKAVVGTAVGIPLGIGMSLAGDFIEEKIYDMTERHAMKKDLKRIEKASGIIACREGNVATIKVIK